MTLLLQSTDYLEGYDTIIFSHDVFLLVAVLHMCCVQVLLLFLSILVSDRPKAYFLSQLYQIVIGHHFVRNNSNSLPLSVSLLSLFLFWHLCNNANTLAAQTTLCFLFLASVPNLLMHCQTNCNQGYHIEGGYHYMNCFLKQMREVCLWNLFSSTSPENCTAHSCLPFNLWKTL